MAFLSTKIGLQIQKEGLEFEMEMVDGKYWGDYEKSTKSNIYDQDHEKDSYFNDQNDRYSDDHGKNGFNDRWTADKHESNSFFKENFDKFRTHFRENSRYQGRNFMLHKYSNILIAY